MKSLKLIENRKIFGIQDWNLVKLCAKQLNDWYFVAKIVLTYCEKKIATYSDQEKLLKFEAEGQEFTIFLSSLEQFIQTVKGRINFW